MEVTKAGGVHDEALLENGKPRNESDEKVSLGQRFGARIGAVFLLTIPCVHAVGYLLMALLGSIILVLAAIAPVVAVLASYGLAQLARPGYNCTLDWIEVELEALIKYVPVYVIMPLFVCACACHAFVVLGPAWVLFRCCFLKVTCLPQTPPAFRSRLISWTLITHFRRIVLYFLFLVIAVLAVYPLICLDVPCLSGIIIAQMCAYALVGVGNVLLFLQHRVIMRLPDKDVSAPTMDKKMLTRRLNKAGLPGF